MREVKKMANKKYEKVEDLPGVGEGAAKKLEEAGFKTIEQIATASVSELKEIAGLGEGTAEKAIKAARDSLDMGFESADVLAEKRKLVGRLTTGSKELDALIGGGIESLPGEEEILILNKNGTLERKEIGKLVEEAITENNIKQSQEKTIVVKENKNHIKAIAFDNDYNIKQKNITAFVKHKRTEKVLEIKISRGKTIQVTAGHSLFKTNGEKIVPTEAGSLKAGDYVAVPKQIRYENDLKEINLVETLSESETNWLERVFAKTPKYVDYLYDYYENEIKQAIKKENKAERFFSDWKYEKILPLNILRHLPKEAYTTQTLKQYEVRIGADKLMNATIPLDEETMWLLGFAFAECGTTKATPQIGINQEITNTQALQKTQTILLQKTGVNAPIFQEVRENSTQNKIITGNMALWLFFKAIGLGEYCHDKKTPNFIFGLKKEKIASFLQGYFEGDGVTKRGIAGWTTSSEEMAKDICTLLTIIGETPVHNKLKHKNPEYKTMHIIYAFQLKDINALGKNPEERQEKNILPVKGMIIKICQEEKLTGKLNKYYNGAQINEPTIRTVKEFCQKAKKYTQNEKIFALEKLAKSDLRFEKISSITERKEQPEYVYDIQTLDNPIIDNFITSNLVCAHNTQSITEVYGKMASGKCVSKDTLILYFNPDTAHLKSIEEIYQTYAVNEIPFDGGVAADLKKPVSVIGIDFNGNIKTATAEKLFKEKVKNITQITTERGTELNLTNKHPLLTISSEGIQWKSSGLIKEGEFIGTPQEIKYLGKETLTKEDAYFLGLFVAEGTGNPLSITAFEPKIQAWLKQFIKTKFGYEPTQSRNKTITLFKKPTKTYLGNLANTNAGTKQVPQEIIASNEETIKAFLAGYIEGDGYLGSTVEMTTKSKKLAHELTYLFTRIGIQTSINEKPVNETTYYRISINGNKNKKIIEKIMEHSIVKNKNLAGEINFSTKYGAPIIAVHPIIMRAYKKLTGSRRRFNKWNKKTMLEGKLNTAFISYLATKPKTERITKETLQQIQDFFKQRMLDLGKTYELLKSPTKEKIIDGLAVLPYKTQEVYKKLGLKRSTFQNYVTRKMPENKIKEIANTLQAMIEETIQDTQLIKDLKTLEITLDQTIAWEKIIKKEEKEYNDWVYDLSVPQTKSFIGGNKPTWLHNSQWCFQTAVTVQLPKEQGGLEGGCLYIDSENSFRPERVIQVAKKFGLEVEQVLKNIYVARAYNAEHQMILADKATEMIKEKNIKLVIVDSLTAQFRAEFVGRGTLAERQQKLNKHMRTLQKLAEMSNVAVLVTNQVMSRPDILFGDPTEPVGGNVVGHASKTRLYLRKSKEDKRVAKLVDSPSLPDGEALYRITENGIEDIDE
jgi:DNA repair protein RadA